MGYVHRGGAWRHSGRTAIFVGDFIDRGPDQLRTLELVRDMIDAGSARAVMGNHEFNAIAWATADPLAEGRHLRARHGPKGERHRQQHQAFLAEVGGDSPAHREWAAWFLDLPLWIEEPEFRVIHACWSPAHVEAMRPRLRSGARLTAALVEEASRKGAHAHAAIEILLKGDEAVLPDGVTFTDKDGHVRRAIRTRWWDPTRTTYRDAYMGPDGIDMPDLAMSDRRILPAPDRPTFIGHYWFSPEETLAPASSLVACVDYSVARGGRMVAYRFDGEATLSAEKFMSV